jgi:hypothetical protein
MVSSLTSAAKRHAIITLFDIYPRANERENTP